MTQLRRMTAVVAAVLALLAVAVVPVVRAAEPYFTENELEMGFAACEPVSTAGDKPTQCKPGTYRTIGDCSFARYEDGLFLLSAELRALNLLQPSEWLVASAMLRNTNSNTGWGSLSVRTSPYFDDETQGYGGGLAEGFVTGRLMHVVLDNAEYIRFGAAPKDAKEKLGEWLAGHDMWMDAQIKEHKDRDVFWAAAAIVDKHARGVADGYKAKMTAVAPGTPLFPAHMLNARPDFGDILASLYPETTKNCWDMTLEEAEARTRDEDHCSMLIAPITPALASGISGDVAVGHATWTHFADMLRLVKSYIFHLRLPQSKDAQIQRPSMMAWHPFREPARDDKGQGGGQDPGLGEDAWGLVMPGYPGLTSSYDDYYALSNSNQLLLVTETTHAACNKTVFTLIQPKTMLTSERALIASILAVTGRDWTHFFSILNSGTYSSSWAVVDTKRHDAAVAVPQPADFLWVAEQMPGLVVARDVTDTFNAQGYWASYNKPAFPEIYKGMGFEKAAEVLGDESSYNKTARAKIFRRELAELRKPGAMTIDEFFGTLRFNDYEHDPLSKGASNYAIGGRYDLKPAGGAAPKTSGNTDAKVMTAGSIAGLDIVNGGGMSVGAALMYAVAGPTCTQQPAFDWRNWPNVQHKGMTEARAFDFAPQKFIYGREAREAEPGIGGFCPNH